MFPSLGFTEVAPPAPTHPGVFIPSASRETGSIVPASPCAQAKHALVNRRAAARVFACPVVCGRHPARGDPQSYLEHMHLAQVFASPRRFVAALLASFEKHHDLVPPREAAGRRQRRGGPRDVRVIGSGRIRPDPLDAWHGSAGILEPYS